MNRDCEHAIPLTTFLLEGGWTASECIQSDGTTALWLLSPHGGQVGCDCPDCAPHEQTGPLPRPWKLRAGLGCAGRTRSGQPCANPVRHQGDLCPAHRGQP